MCTLVSSLKTRIHHSTTQLVPVIITYNKNDAPIPIHHVRIHHGAKENVRWQLAADITHKEPCRSYSRLDKEVKVEWDLEINKLY
jgi:hypothetical protein